MTKRHEKGYMDKRAYKSRGSKITEIYGKETYEFRENSIVVSIPFTRVSTEEIPPVIPSVIPPVNCTVNDFFGCISSPSTL